MRRISFLFAVVPIVVNTFTGVKGVDPVLIRCARSFNASPMDLFLTFALPGALPMIFAGLRLGIGRALIGGVIAELFSSNAGVEFHKLDITALTYKILFRIFNPRKRKFLVRQAKLDESCWLRR